MSQTLPVPPPPELPGGWKLIWSDEFEQPAGTPPDPSRWKYNLGGEGWGNAEWQHYTESLENASANGEGLLVIRALPVESSDDSRLKCWYGPCKYTSARLLTHEKFHFTYGRVEARLKIPYGQGIWPAIWMLGDNASTAGWPGCGEIDIMENVGREPDQIHSTVHGPGYSGIHGKTFSYSLAGGQAFKDNFHIFALEWEADEIRWYVDDAHYGTLKKEDFSTDQPWVFDHPFFLIMNFAVGGGWPGYPDETTIFPQEMQVDYIRVYQR